jgi:hypothetical protein
MFKTIPLVLSASLVFVACAGHRPPDSNTPSGSGAASGDAKGSGWADAQREKFMQGCTAQVKAPDYCACGFDQFKEVFKDGPPPEGDAAKERFAALGERTKTECSSKLPEDVMKSSFISACAEDDKRKNAYCECAWPALRKNLALSDFATDFQGPRFDDAKKAMAKTCKGKFPVEVAKASFMQGCTKDDAGKAKSCECLWKKVHAKFSAEEVVAGLVSIDQVAGIAECK